MVQAFVWETEGGREREAGDSAMAGTMVSGVRLWYWRSAESGGMRNWTWKREREALENYNTFELSSREEIRFTSDANQFFFLDNIETICTPLENCRRVTSEPKESHGVFLSGPLRGMVTNYWKRLSENLQPSLNLVQNACDEGPPCSTKHLLGHHCKPLWWHS